MNGMNKPTAPPHSHAATAIAPHGAEMVKIQKPGL
jgi:hypothetical protein